jgi:hypothetical protein
MAEEVFGPYTREAAEGVVTTLARAQTGSQRFYAYVTTWYPTR